MLLPTKLQSRIKAYTIGQGLVMQIIKVLKIMISEKVKN